MYHAVYQDCDIKAGGLHPVRCWHFGLPSAEHFILCQTVISK